MPPGTPFNAFIPPYPIRIDEFTSLPPSSSSSHQPLLHLLTHAHSDHTLGLAAKSFGYPVICSADTKEMLLRHEVYKERELLERGVRAEKVRTYGHLKVGCLDGEGDEGGGGVGGVKRDLLREIPVNTPRRVQLNSEEEVVVTAIDANHCPGSVMYLIEGSKGTILHTGDVRVEPWFIESLKHNPYLQPYLYPGSASASPSGDGGGISKTLEAIYLDTACVFTTFNVPTKEEAIQGLTELMHLYPEESHFFLNCWTWGYEDVLKGVARAFQSKIHLDRYKHTILSRLLDPFLRSIITRDENTRFHACERFGRCERVLCDSSSSAFSSSSTSASTSHPSGGGKNGTERNAGGERGEGYVKNGKTYSSRSKTGHRVVYVNPVTMGAASWRFYRQEVRDALQGGEGVDCLLVPLCRHSPLPELQSLVNLFRPKRIVPNTLDTALAGLDWAAIDVAFEPYLHPSSQSSPSSNSLWNSFLAPLGFTKPSINPLLIDRLVGVDMEEERDAAVKNLASGVGDEEGKVKELVERWADSGKVGRKVGVVRGILSAASEAAASSSVMNATTTKWALGTTSANPQSNWLNTELYPDHASQSQNQNQIYEREEETQESQVDDEEAHERTARLLFCSSTQEWGVLLGEEERRLREEKEVEVSGQTQVEKGEVVVAGEKGEDKEGERDGKKMWMGQLTPVSSPAPAPRPTKGKGKEKQREREPEQEEEVQLDSQGYNRDVNVPLVFVKGPPRKMVKDQRERMEKRFGLGGFASFSRFGMGMGEDEEEFAKPPPKKKDVSQDEEAEEPMDKIPLMNMALPPDKTPVTKDKEELKVPLTPGKSSERRFGTPDTATPAVLSSGSTSDVGCLSTADADMKGAHGRRRSPLNRGSPVFPLYEGGGLGGEGREDGGKEKREKGGEMRALESPVKILSSTMRTLEAPAKISKMRTLEAPAKTRRHESPVNGQGPFREPATNGKGEKGEKVRGLESPVKISSSTMHTLEAPAKISKMYTLEAPSKTRRHESSVKAQGSTLSEPARTNMLKTPQTSDTPLTLRGGASDRAEEGRSLASPICLLSSSPAEEMALFTWTGTPLQGASARKALARRAREQEKESVSKSPLAEVGNGILARVPRGSLMKRVREEGGDLRVAKRVKVDVGVSGKRGESEGRPVKRAIESADSEDRPGSSSLRKGIHSTDDRPAKRVHVSSSHPLRPFKSQPSPSKRDTRRPTLGTSISADAIPPKSESPSEADLTLLRIQIGEKLEKAFPKEILAPPEKIRKRRDALYAKYYKLRAKEQRASMGVGVSPRVPKEEEKDSGHPMGEGDICVTEEDDHAGVDWDRSRRIAEAARHDLENGRPPTFPALVCLERQDSELDSQ